MPSSALHDCSSTESLFEAWKELYSNSSRSSRNTRGIDGESINSFATARDSNLKALRLSMRDSGGYNFSSLRAVVIPKPNGTNRVICIPTVTDRVAQKAVNEFLADGDKCGVANSVSYGFIKGRSVKQAARNAKRLRKSHRWAYKADITKFFDSIDRSILNQEIKKKVPYPSLHFFLTSAVACEISELRKNPREEIAKCGINEGHGVRQGMPLSPFFANLLLRDFDQMAEREGIRLVRYADDLIVLCSSKKECEKVHELFTRELRRLGLSIPEPGKNSKTQIYEPGQPAEFLGVSLVPNGNGYSLEVTKEITNRIRARFSALSDLETLVKRNVTLGKLNQMLDSVCSGYIAVYDYCDNVRQFEQAVNSEKEKTLRRIYEAGLGLNLDALTSQQKQFLSLRV